MDLTRATSQIELKGLKQERRASRVSTAGAQSPHRSGERRPLVEKAPLRRDARTGSSPTSTSQMTSTGATSEKRVNMVLMLMSASRIFGPVLYHPTTFSLAARRGSVVSFHDTNMCGGPP